jgi:hypothetical protein
MFVAFNLRRIINIIGIDKLKTWLKSLFFKLWEAFCRLFRPISPIGVLQPKKMSSRLPAHFHYYAVYLAKEKINGSFLESLPRHGGGLPLCTSGRKPTR